MPQWYICLQSGCPEMTDHRTRRCDAHRLARSPSSAATSKPGWKKLRAEVLERDAYMCQVQLPGCIGRASVVDHVEGVAYGGSGDRSNLQACCQPCNDRKKGQAPLKREDR